jgi:amino acid transporter
MPHTKRKQGLASMTPDSQPGLRRSLKLWHLIVYGIVIIQPTAPMGIYGVVSNVAGGHVVTTILIAMVAMLFTAFSYGRMARVYPSAGSAYTYVGRELNPLLGYVVGWSMLMDYLLNPIICAIWCSAAAQNVIPSVPYAAWAVSFVVLFTVLNLRGVKTSGRVNALLALGMTIVVVVFLAEAVRYIALVLHPLAGDWLLPFYDPASFNSSRVLRGTSIAVLTYIGFDGISTMSEEVENPRRNILLATVATCLVIGILSAIEVYVAQLVWPGRTPFPEAMVDTAYVFVAQRVGGTFLFHLINGTLLIANLGSGMAAQFGAARLLYGMGRANALPSRIFGAIDARTGIPRNNVLAVGVFTLGGVFLLTYQSGAELLNFGAFIAFMGVNAAALVHYKFRSTEKVFLPAAMPVLGFVVSAFIWLNLNHKAQLLGTVWVLIGVALYFIMRRTGADQGKLMEIDEAQEGV